MRASLRAQLLRTQTIHTVSFGPQWTQPGKQAGDWQEEGSLINRSQTETELSQSTAPQCHIVSIIKKTSFLFMRPLQLLGWSLIKKG